MLLSNLHFRPPTPTLTLKRGGGALELWAGHNLTLKLWLNGDRWRGKRGRSDTYCEVLVDFSMVETLAIPKFPSLPRGTLQTNLKTASKFALCFASGKLAVHIIGLSPTTSGRLFLFVLVSSLALKDSLWVCWI